MNNVGLNRLRSKLGWIIKKRQLKKSGVNCHVGYNLVLKNPKGISIGNNFIAGKNLTMEVWNECNDKEKINEAIITIGNDVSVMDDCQFSAAIGIEIGDGSLLGNNVFITDNFHGKHEINELDIPPSKRNLFVKGKVVIGRNVWIGRNVCIMPNVIVGDGVIIGANAVVTKDIPAYSVAAGVPAKLIKK